MARQISRALRYSYTSRATHHRESPHSMARPTEPGGVVSMAPPPGVDGATEMGATASVTMQLNSAPNVCHSVANISTWARGGRRPGGAPAPRRHPQDSETPPPGAAGAHATADPS